MEELTYDHMSEKLVERLPELRERYEAELKWWAEETPGPHIIYGDVLNPYLISALKSGGEEDFLRRAFALLEELANHPDVHVQEVVAVTVVERLVGNQEILAVARKYMGETTLRFSYDIENWRPVDG